jgi:protein CWC15
VFCSFACEALNVANAVINHSEEEDDSDDDEDDTAELLRELEKIKRERAEEKARQESAQSASDAATREADIATSNPLLNLAAALGQDAPSGINTTAPGTFAVKKRWDDGMLQTMFTSTSQN